MKIRQTFAFIALAIGANLAVATFAWKSQFLALFQTEHAIVTSFIIAVVLFIPFVFTFTQLGLNSAEGETPSPETKRRLKLLSSQCSMWPVTWYSALGFIGFSWLAFFLVGDIVNPFFAMSAALASLSGSWFLFVYPVARRLFKDFPNNTA
ncbi:hypothetical protein [uncultured Rubinisphaera sp.]|uniref:hypothetical protein n=1 Tax=uncultured Rubinisphaera sp. TaxID=1678686 RepID=UPI000ED55A24|nr:hypothetical protein [Planctomycetaceae bacterium]|tara:strand:- start:2698 stop:3150 length:453 start_codon:yes stop_codon:yes gene_type:complete